MLDALGVAIAAGPADFVNRAVAAVEDLADDGGGDATVIGASRGYPLRDAILLNGVLVHGLDYDETHPAGVVHGTASALPTALGLAEKLGSTGQEFLTAFIIGLEVNARLGMAAQGGFHRVGFHPTGLVGAFGASLIAGRLRGLGAAQLAEAQGFVGSLASGSMAFLDTGAWTKRIHPGWAGVAGTTAASFAAQGFPSPPDIYEGRFGLYATHLEDLGRADLEVCTDSLGVRWETMQVAVKPYPACHFTHAFADAALAIRALHGVAVEDIAMVTCLIAPGEVSTVCEPLDRKRAPCSSYEAQFSVPYVTAAALRHGEFTLRQLEPEALRDPVVLALAAKVDYVEDPASGFPASFSGEVVVKTKDGRVVRHREQINRGAGDRPLGRSEIEAKFASTAGSVRSNSEIEQLVNTVTKLGSAVNLAELAGLLRA